MPLPRALVVVLDSKELAGAWTMMEKVTTLTLTG